MKGIKEDLYTLNFLELQEKLLSKINIFVIRKIMGIQTCLSNF